MKVFLAFLTSIIITSVCFSQSVFNNVYTSDSNNISIGIQTVVTDNQSNIFASCIKVNNGLLGYAIKKYDSNGVETSSYFSNSTKPLRTGFKKSLIFSHYYEQLIHAYSSPSDSIICVERLNLDLQLVNETCVKGGGENRIYSMDILNDSLLVLGIVMLEEGSTIRGDSWLILFNLDDNEVMWRRNLGKINFSEVIPIVSIFNDLIYVTFGDQNFDSHLIVYHQQGYPIKDTMYADIDILEWSENQVGNTYLFMTGREKLSNEGVFLYKIDANSLEIGYVRNYLDENNAVAENSVIYREELHSVGYTATSDSSFLLVTDLNTGDSLDIHWYASDDGYAINDLRGITKLKEGGLILAGEARTGVSGVRCPWLIKTDQYGCDSQLCLDVEEIAEEENVWSIYPNPTKHSDYISVELNLPLADLSNPELQVFNSSGVLMNIISIKQKAFQLQKPAHTGFYMVVLKDENKVVSTQKWMVL